MSIEIIRREAQRDEPWANGAGTTTVVWREPDDPQWRVRVSVARVDHAGPFSDLPGTRRILVPLDASIRLRFPDGTTAHASRFGVLRFEGSPSPASELPDGPTRDFNLMLRGGAQGDVVPRTLVGSMLLPPAPGLRWLAWLHSGRACIGTDTPGGRVLDPGDAALVPGSDDAARVRLDGSGEIVLIKLYP